MKKSLSDIGAIALLMVIFCVAQDAITVRVDGKMNAEMLKQRIPGLSVAVIKDGRMVLAKGYGLANVEQSPAASTPDYIERGNKQNARGNIDEAIVSYTKAIELGQRVALAYLLRGAAYHLKRDEDRAMDDLTSAIALDPGMIDAYFLRAETKESKKDFAGALIDIERVLQLTTGDQRALMRHGELKTLNGDTDAAVSDFQRAIEIDPKSELGRSAAVAIRVIRHDIREDEVIADLDELIANGFKNVPEAYFHRGTVHMRLGHLDEALADFSKTLRLDPHNAFALLDRGNVRQGKDDTQGAIDDYTKAIEIDPELAWAWGNRGVARLLMGDAVNAQKDLDRCLEIDPSLKSLLAVRIKLAKEKMGIKNQPDQ